VRVRGRHARHCTAIVADESAWRIAALLAAVLAPWFGAGGQSAVPSLQRLWRGLAVLTALAFVNVTAAAATATPVELMHGIAAGAAMAAGVMTVLLLVSIRRAFTRMRAPATRARLAAMTQLPRWFVLPAAVVGAAADDSSRRFAALAAVEIRSGAAWLAAAGTLLAQFAIRAPYALASTACGVMILAAVAAWHRRLALPGEARD